MTHFLKAAEIGTGGARTLPGAFYTSPEIFREEQEMAFHRFDGHSVKPQSLKCYLHSRRG
jgi:hypothetical protein